MNEPQQSRHILSSAESRHIASPGDAVADPIALRRDDLAAAVAAYRQKNRGPRAWAGVSMGIGAMLAAAVLITIGENRGWPELLGPIFLAGGWLVLLGSLAVAWRRERRLRAQFQIHCPTCGEALLDGTLGRAGVPRAELAITTGNCPHCAAQIFRQ